MADKHESHESHSSSHASHESKHESPAAPAHAAVLQHARADRQRELDRRALIKQAQQEAEQDLAKPLVRSEGVHASAKKASA